MTSMPSDVTALLCAWQDGDQRALALLTPVVHHQLRALAAKHFRGERQGHTLQPTALVNEAFIRLIEQKPDRWRDRQHFFALASRLMRRILVDHARRRQAEKRRAQVSAMAFDDGVMATPGSAAPTVDIVLLDTALTELAARDARMGRVVELRFFGGLTIAETAQVLEVSPGTVKTDWQLAKAWLLERMG